MAAPDTELARFLADEIQKYEGILVPVRAGFFERTFKKKVAIGKLHPNPDDEFCVPSVGPNYSIYYRYVRTFQRFGTMQQNVEDEPLMVEKVHPDGYMILNGHHRWAAAMRVGFKTVPVKIVNLTQETDILKMIQNSTHDIRVTLDLDEVVFCTDENEAAEKPLHFPFNRFYTEKIRLGIPALLQFLSKHGFDIWVYTSKYYSLDYIRQYFKHYSVKVDGIITGTARKFSAFTEQKKKTDALLAGKYKETFHIDRTAVLRTIRDSGEFQEYKVDDTSGRWSTRMISIFRKITEEKQEKENGEEK